MGAVGRNGRAARGLVAYARWLHTGFPAGTVERLPEVGPDGATSVAGVRIAGDLVGTPLLKLAVESGAAAVRAFAREPGFATRAPREGVVDVAIVGAGPSGISAALEARAKGLSAVVLEASEAFQTIRDFPAGKPIFTYPTDLAPDAPLRVEGDTKERLLASLLDQQHASGLSVAPGRVVGLRREGGVLVLEGERGVALARAHRVLLAIGRSGDYRKLGVPGESLPKVHHRLHDPKDFEGRHVLVVGGGDSAVEAAIALAEAGATVTLCHRGAALVRPKAANLARLEMLAGRLDLRLATKVVAIDEAHARLEGPHGGVRIPNDVVFAMIGREAPLGLLRRLGVRIRNEWHARDVLAFVAFVAFCTFVYSWKSGGALTTAFREHGWFPFGVSAALGGERAPWPVRVLAPTLDDPGFYYSFAYTAAVFVFGVRRVARKKTPYVRLQTTLLVAIQTTLLFLVPYVLLPLLGAAGAFDAGFGKTFADAFFPVVSYGHGREYWRAFGFVLAWPLFVWNFFTAQPMKAWLVVGAVQTFVLIPWIVRRWGKGAYCGFLCSCGALAETLGDAHREKMPHGPFWKRVDMLGQVVLFAASVLFALRLWSWESPRATLFGTRVGRLFSTLLSDNTVLGLPLDYYHLVDLTLAGIVGVGFYFWFSGRVWCRFACPLAALMHVYARAFTRFRIFAEKKRCISCNQCTAVCHQGIDVMSFANKGLPMDDPQCVRCSACVQVCPTATLAFGRLAEDGTPVLDTVEASPVRIRELHGGREKVRLPLVR